MQREHTSIMQALRVNRNELIAREGYSEEDTKRLLIAPMLNYLGYPDDFRRSELHVRSNKPDEVIWDKPVSLSGNSPCQIILEAKPLGTDFDTGSSRTETPARQLKRYLQGHSASGPNTYGVLTDGNHYRISQRTGHGVDVRHIGDWEVLDEQSLFEGADNISELFDILCHASISQTSQPELKKTSAVRGLTDAIADGLSPNAILDIITRERQTRPSISDVIQLTGKTLDAERNDWEDHVWRYGVELLAERDTPRLIQGDADDKVVTAVIRYSASEPGAPEGLPRGDIALAALAFARIGSQRTAVVITYQANSTGEVDRARVAVHHNGHTGMTPEFDPQNPAPSVLDNLEKIRTALNSRRPIKPERLTSPVTAKRIRREFYGSIAQWVKSKQAGKTREQRHAILRHLIRTVFAWILKEDGIIPSDPFEESFAAQHGNGDYHSNVLTFMFHQRLNTPGYDRVEHSSDSVQNALASTPFLNGSLFAEHPGDDDFELNDDDYFGTIPNGPGLFTIMSRYDWTTAEHTPRESDQTIDPEMLSNLFENLVAATEFWIENPDRMPAGTYYTPADVATEMVKDALASAVRNSAPDKMTDSDLRAIFSDSEMNIDNLSVGETIQLRQAIGDLTIFDPSVGSGEFPLIVVKALRTALNNLGDTRDDLTRRIIKSQIYAQDINQMATHITRLRLFIAIVSSERRFNAIEALPNLESRIVCADTLETVARPEWRPEATGQLVDNQARDALMDLAYIRRQWLDAHVEEQKNVVRQNDVRARAKLLEIQERNATMPPEIEGFARHELLSLENQPARTDARLLFYDPNYNGFDVVIGNPPYEVIGKGKAESCRRAIKDKLRGPKEYSTVAGGDLYNLFCELALTLVKQEDGVVTLVVPLSLAFGQNKAGTRRLFERRSKKIMLRHQDNRPDKTFHESPVAHPENRQRTTIITAVTGSERPIIQTTGTGKWGKPEREQYLLSRRYNMMPERPTQGQPQIITQWPRVPSEEVGRLISEMQAQRHTIADLSNRVEDEYAIAFPQTAYEFITAAPADKLDRNEIVQPIANSEYMELAMAALNGNAAYAWWRVWGDAFHINKYELNSVAIPDRWLDDKRVKSQARRFGRRLIAAITPDNIDIRSSGPHGNTFENVNFHDVVPQTVREIDHLYLSALGLPVDLLLEQLSTIRSNSNWRL